MTIDELLAAAGLTANDEIPIWDAEATGEPTKKITAQNLAAAVVALANLVTGVKGDAESSYRQGNVNITPANIGALPDTTPIPSKTSDLTNDSGFLTAQTGVTGVKGDAESSYRQGNVNITPANIGAVSASAIIDISHGGTGATTPAGACAALAPGIPTSSYSTSITWTSTTAAFNADDGVRCVKYGNGLKRIIGLFSVSGSGIAAGGAIFHVPIDYQYLRMNNGSIQGWGTITEISGSASYLFRFAETGVVSWGSAIPAGSYIINYLYF